MTNPFYYNHAFVQRDYVDNAKESNERLEFLGDSIFTAAVTEYLFNKYPSRAEGDLSKMRSRIVQGTNMVMIAKSMGIGKYIKAHVEDGVQPSDNPRFLEDVFEALVGAIFLDKGYDHVKLFTEAVIKHHVQESVILTNTNYKDILIQFARLFGIEYSFINKKTDKLYHVHVKMAGENYKEFTAPKLITAEQNAAKFVIDALEITEEIMDRKAEIKPLVRNNAVVKK